MVLKHGKTNQRTTKSALPIMPGDMKWKDINEDGIIDSYDQVVAGNTTPTGPVASTLLYAGKISNFMVVLTLLWTIGSMTTLYLRYS